MVLDGVGDQLVLPQSPTASLHIADAGDTIDDALVVSVGGLEVVEKLWMISSGRFAREVVLIADEDGTGGIVVNHLSILYPDAGNSVSGGGHDIRVIKAEVLRIGQELLIPVLSRGIIPETEVPLPDPSGSVSCLSEEIGDRVLLRMYDHRSISAGDAGVLPLPGVVTGEEGVA